MAKRLTTRRNEPNPMYVKMFKTRVMLEKAVELDPDCRKMSKLIRDAVEDYLKRQKWFK